ncbi:hypothetical protein [Micromonospora sp. CPCC 206061]|uniref:hypothetical protein n=1 Tax=Micromonospora sp. CPCC 206061 TaxID=3122410 RepID=UPI002FF1E54F
MTDEDQLANDLLGPLRDPRVGPAQPSAANVSAAVLSGRRKIRLRRIGTVAAGASVTMLAVASGVFAATATRPDAPPAAIELPTPSATTSADNSPDPAGSGGLPTGCRLAQLPVPGDPAQSIATGIDPTGRYVVGRSQSADGKSHVIMWDDGTPQQIPVPGSDQRLVDVNAAGEAVGSSFQGGKEVPWVYRDGKLNRLGGSAGTVPVAINQAGRIAGYRNVSSDRAVPVVWQAWNEEPVDLPLPGEASKGYASDVADDGTVVGTVYLAGDNPAGERGYLWPTSGSASTLPLPTVEGVQAKGFHALTLTDERRDDAGRLEAGRVTGSVARKVPGQKELVHDYVHVDVRTGAAIVLPEQEPFAQANGHNKLGWLAGQTGILEQSLPAILTPDGLLRLPRPKNLTSLTATGLSDDGRVIVGHGSDSQARTQALEWRCQR